MSLRRDVHSAFDEITPSITGLSERVVQTVVVEGTTRRRKENMWFRVRAPLSLVAIVLLVALVVAVLVGGRILQDWNATHKVSQAGTGSALVGTLVQSATSGCLYQSLTDATVGTVLIEVVNESTDMVRVIVSLIDKDHQYAELAAYIAQEQARLEARQDPIGPPSYVADWAVKEYEAGAVGRLSMKLTQPGTYGIVCTLVKAGSADQELRISLAGPLRVIS